jgi:hypothetical protein
MDMIVASAFHAIQDREKGSNKLVRHGEALEVR